MAVYGVFSRDNTSSERNDQNCLFIVYFALMTGIQATPTGVWTVARHYGDERRVPSHVPSAGHDERNGERGEETVPEQNHPRLLPFVHRTGIVLKI